MIPIQLRIEIPGQADVEIIPGDSVDLGKHGVLRWLKDEDAEAWRLEQQKRHREVNEIIARVERSGNEKI